MLKLIENKKEEVRGIPALKVHGPEALGHHQQLIEGYIQSHKIRNHSENTIDEISRVLKAWFSLYGTEGRPLYIWEAMEPVYGRRRIVGYGQALVEAEIVPNTVRRYLGILKGFFNYVLEHPYVFERETAKNLSHLYGPLEQPVSEFDIPVHLYDDQQLGVPFDPARLYDFYAVLRKHYLNFGRGCVHHKARNYAMVVLAGESGLRANELNHLETERDLFFEGRKLQTRNAKATGGSGKRTRVTLFTPLARDTISFYIKNHRPHLCPKESPYLFPSSRSGNPISYGAMLDDLGIMKMVANQNGFTVAEHMSWHWLRRIFATRFIERFPHQLHVLVELLGHVTPNTVHKYIRHSEAWMDGKILEILRGIEVERDSLEA